MKNSTSAKTHEIPFPDCTVPAVPQARLNSALDTTAGTAGTITVIWEPGLKQQKCAIFVAAACKFSVPPILHYKKLQGFENVTLRLLHDIEMNLSDISFQNLLSQFPLGVVFPTHNTRFD